jgi:hypothetical protein
MGASRRLRRTSCVSFALAAVAASFSACSPGGDSETGGPTTTTAVPQTTDAQGSTTTSPTVDPTRHTIPPPPSRDDQEDQTPTPDTILVRIGGFDAPEQVIVVGEWDTIDHTLVGGSGQTTGDVPQGSEEAAKAVAEYNNLADLLARRAVGTTLANFTLRSDSVCLVYVIASHAGDETMRAVVSGSLRPLQGAALDEFAHAVNFCIPSYALAWAAGIDVKDESVKQCMDQRVTQAQKEAFARAFLAGDDAATKTSAKVLSDAIRACS